MRILRLIAAVTFAAHSVVAPARADQILPQGRILETGPNAGDLLFGAVKFGRRQNGKLTLTPDAVQIQGTGSTGDISSMTVGGSAISGILNNKAQIGAGVNFSSVGFTGKNVQIYSDSGQQNFVIRTGAPGSDKYNAFNADGSLTMQATVTAPTVNATAFNGTTINAYTSSSAGSSSLYAGDTTHSGYTAFFRPNSSRVGYIGYENGGLINIAADSGYSYNFNTVPYMNGSVMHYNGMSGATFGGTTLHTPGTVTPQAIYGAAFPNVVFSDTVQGVLDVPAGDTNDNRAAVAGYVRTKSGSATPSPGKGNAVALDGVVLIDANNSAGWAMNGLITDNNTRATHNGTGRIGIGAELDFNIMSPNTHIAGVSIGGNSLAQPVDANGYIVNSLGNGFRWGTGFWCVDGAAERCMVAAPKQATGYNIDSAETWFQSLDGTGSNGTGTKRTTKLYQRGTFLRLGELTGGAWGGLAIDGGNLSLDADRGLAIGGNAVVISRETGWSAGTGTVNKGAFDANYTQTISASYSQGQVQALQNDLVNAKQRILALEAALRRHGLIN